MCAPLPVDTTRVLLGKDGGYINANFIKMSVKDEKYAYIACQGPLPTTLCDFWQMVLEQKSNVIAMMTREVEGGKVKCQRYWPDTPRTAEMVDDRLQITLLKDQHLDNFVIRLIEVKDVHVSVRSALTPLCLFSNHDTKVCLTSAPASSDQWNAARHTSELHGVARPRNTLTTGTAAHVHLLHETRSSVGPHHHTLQRRHWPVGDSHLYWHSSGPHQ